MKSANQAKSLRNKQTDCEKALWQALRSRLLAGYKFRRQFPIGNYIVDFVCYAHRLIIEVDGGQHADNKFYDDLRTEYLKRNGYRILRFWNNEVMENIDGVKDAILTELNSIAPHPIHLPQEELV